DEVTALYPAFGAGLPSPLPELPVQYADFAVWQRAWLAGEELERQLAFWRAQLSGAPTSLDLPGDRPRPAQASHRGARRGRRLPAALEAGLRRFGREQGTTLFMNLLAAAGALLGRWVGQRDLVLGTPIAGRNRLEVERLIGFFVNTLPLRVDLSDGPDFEHLVRRVREMALAAYEHQDLPFEKLVEELRVERNLGHSPLFQAMLSLPSTGRPRGSREEGRSLTVGTGTAKFELTLEVREEAAGLGLSAEFSTDLFDGVTIDRLLAHLEILVEGMVEEPGRRPEDVAQLAGAERHALLVEWNDTSRPELPGLCLHQPFERRAVLVPEETALVTAAERLSYGELNRRANRLAHHLRRLGVGPEPRVGVLLERSAGMVVTLLAVLKAGGAYVALDPAYPVERLGLMAWDAGLSVLVTEQRLGVSLPVGAGVRIVRLDSDGPEIAAAPAHDPEARAVPGNLAYLIYTSGSTGRPKAVGIEHRSAMALVRWAGEVFPEEDLDGVLAATSISFDLSVFELFVPLSWGGKVVLAANALELPELAAAGEVRLINTVPSAMAELAAGTLPPSVRTVNLAGEALKQSLVEQVYRHAGVERVLNLYGPSEDTTYSTFARVERGGRVTIGRPLSGTRVHLLERGGVTPSPLGVAGELCLGGDGLARGYLGRPELTAERFVPDPFAGSAGERLYRTGDLARHLSDGRLEFLGRLDHQVKVRGFRVEPGEIEAALSEHPDIWEAAVVPREEPPGETRLAAYLVAGDEPPSAAELRSFLLETLPEHMVPSQFFTLGFLPLTPSGKVDRGALARMGTPSERVASGLDETAMPPRDDLELELVRIWEEVLGTPSVGVTDDFFTLGGHSLLAIRLLDRVARQTGVDLAVSSIFQAPTIERLADLLRRQIDAPHTRPALVPIRPDGSLSPFFCVHAAGGNVFAYVELARRLGPDRPFYGLQTPEPLPGGGSVEELAACYVDAVRAAQPAGPYHLGGWSMGGVVAFEMARQLEAAGDEVRLLALIDSPWPDTGRDDAGPESGADGAELLAAFVRDLTGADLPVPLEELGRLSHEERMARALAFAHRAGALPAAGTGGAAIDRLFAVFAHNIRARRAYRPGPYGGHVDLFLAEDSTAFEEERRWGGVAGGGVEVHSLPGDHYSILKAPAVGTLARRLLTCLETAEAGAAGSATGAHTHHPPDPTGGET
ncbi:MAG TPA: amino acid adenylation domain-containing protein, partial [Thermoanaerobaculia bacterium]|nr:amino acid adenylation domain-containing protein [Thermoanaerobaculia bacterium]